MMMFINILTADERGNKLPDMSNPTHKNPRKRPVTIFLDLADFEKLTATCLERGISRADFLRCALAAAEKIPTRKTRPLSGACKAKHEARIRRETRARGKKKGDAEKG